MPAADSTFSNSAFSEGLRLDRKACGNAETQSSRLELRTPYCVLRTLLLPQSSTLHSVTRHRATRGASPAAEHVRAIHHPPSSILHPRSVLQLALFLKPFETPHPQLLPPVDLDRNRQ